MGLYYAHVTGPRPLPYSEMQSWALSDPGFSTVVVLWALAKRPRLLLRGFEGSSEEDWLALFSALRPERNNIGSTSSRLEGEIDVDVETDMELDWDRPRDRSAPRQRDRIRGRLQASSKVEVTLTRKGRSVSSSVSLGLKADVMTSDLAGWALAPALSPDAGGLSGRAWFLRLQIQLRSFSRRLVAAASVRDDSQSSDFDAGFDAGFEIGCLNSGLLSVDSSASVDASFYTPGSAPLPSTSANSPDTLYLSITAVSLLNLHRFTSSI